MPASLKMNLRKGKDYPEVRGFCFGKEGERKFLVFRISREEYGVALPYIREVIKVNEIRSLPETPEFIEGITCLRGHLIVVMNLRKRLHLKEPETPDRKGIICQVQRKVFGFLVEELGEILSIPQESIKTIPEIVSEREGHELISEIAQIGSRMIPLINLERIFIFGSPPMRMK